MSKVIIFTDLDGTLLDYESYSFASALAALELLREKDIPLIISSSKTKAEIEYYRRRLDNAHPFVSENGGGIFIPRGYFDDRILGEKSMEDANGYYLIRLGARYEALREVIKKLRKASYKVKGFGDMTVEEVIALTGLSKEEATMAKERDFDEVFIIEKDEDRLEEILNFIKREGFHYTQGKFYHIMGESDKGKATKILIDMYRKRLGNIVTVAVGDSLNDFPMLKVVDYPILVQKPDGFHDPKVPDFPGLIKVEGIGPVGWNKAMLDLLKDIDP